MNPLWSRMKRNEPMRPKHTGGVFRVDLHFHSTFSDGLNTPEELCRMAERYQLDALALCDHDTLDGQADMARAVAKRNREREQQGLTPMRLVTGAEISTGQGGRTHLLCYGTDGANAELDAFLAQAARERRERAGRMLYLLEREGIRLGDEQARMLDRPGVGRAHIARAMVACGAVSSVKEAFDRYLIEGRPAYTPRRLLPTTEALAFLSKLGLVVVLAHPMLLGLSEPVLLAQLLDWQRNGLMGVEAFHPSASHAQARALEAFARREGLLVTGGSDYHGDAEARARLGRLPTAWTHAREDVDALLTAISTNDTR